MWVVPERRVRGVMAAFGGGLYAQALAGRRVWALELDRRGVVRLPAWGFIETGDGPLLIGGWGLPVVTENRARLSPAAPRPTSERSPELAPELAPDPAP